MKRYFLLWALLCTFAVNAVAQHAASKIVGVWQQVQQSKSDGHEMQLPVWKVLQSDGRFCTFLIANQIGQSIITNQGTYQLTDETTCVEHIDGSITDPELVGKQNTLTLQFKSDDLLEVTYRIPGATRDGHEVWRRVKLELPQP